ncbi:uncharacterized protein Gasu_17420 [Galdieria sulphuraria]|uniref:Uncharacterized protein n=1 Tax=Galdieria sulphuraria TaxID=130081 RepID=M2Y547_GALSU|nr:uncharacterized protein Gasu_17420 [Galdieria sulphuraria]EME30979.1 hypothetical protein Gasu_17420 [Galdieria sulphuraria]|eukprot:XP_005707499.1 hypothetical protein Gasu_17420 [Galdieria sulphuraria]
MESSKGGNIQEGDNKLSDELFLDHEDSNSSSVLSLCEEFQKEAKKGTSFDVEEFINSKFPTEDSLTTLDSFIARVKATVSRLDDDLSQKVREERFDSNKSSQYIAQAKEKLFQLRKQMNNFSIDAINAEGKLNSVCAEIRTLEITRRNISKTLEAIKDLQSFEEAVEACENSWNRKDWKRCAILFPDLIKFLRRFEELEEYQELGKIPALIRKAKELSNHMQESISEQLRLFGPTGLADISSNSEKQQQIQQLQAMCKIMDYLSNDSRREVIDWYIHSRIAAYEAIFGPGGEAAAVEATERRFAWLRRELRYLEEYWKDIFPEEWNIAFKLANSFCTTTRRHLTAELEKRSPGDVTVLLRVLQKTFEFEQELERRFLHSTFGTQEKRRFSTISSHSEDSELPTNSKHHFVGLVSTCFEPYMGAYSALEDKNLGELLQKLITEETWVVESPSTVLKSSTELFLQIKRCMKRCGALTTNQTFFNLHKVFKKHLKSYAHSLGEQLSKQGRSNSTSGFSFISKDVLPPSFHIQPLELNDAEERTICYIVSTAEYCASTVEQLVNSIKKKVDPVFADNVQMDVERDEFRAVAAKGLRSLAVGLYTRFQKHLNLMTQINWNNIQSVGDSSSYVAKLEEEFFRSLPSLANLLSFVHFRYFCDRFVAIFIPAYLTTLKTCKKVSSISAQQLLLDAAAIKNMLQNVPFIAYPNNASREDHKEERVQSEFLAPWSSYQKFVNKEMTKVELILKVLLSPLESIVDTYVALIPDSSIGELNQLLEMKGLKKTSAAPYIVRYTHLAGKDFPTQSNQTQGPEAMDKIEKPGVLNRLGEKWRERRNSRS